MDTAIQKAQERIGFVQDSKEELRAYQMRELAMCDYTSTINHARREGIAIGEQRGERKGERRGEKRGITIGKQQGIAIGEQQGKIKYVLKLSQKGMSVDEMAELTDLSVEEVKNILNS